MYTCKRVTDKKHVWPTTLVLLRLSLDAVCARLSKQIVCGPICVCHKRQTNKLSATYNICVYIYTYLSLNLSLKISTFPMCQDVLGYNVTLNADAPGSGSVAGYYSVTGCRNPSNTSDRGCMQGVPRWKSQTLTHEKRQYQVAVGFLQYGNLYQTTFRHNPQ